MTGTLKLGLCTVIIAFVTFMFSLVYSVLYNAFVEETRGKKVYTTKTNHKNKFSNENYNIPMKTSPLIRGRLVFIFSFNLNKRSPQPSLVLYTYLL